MKSKTLLINLYAGPGTGKSTIMAGVFSKLKLKGINCEMAPEYAKEKVWEESYKVLENQIYVFGKQLHTIHRLIGKVDIIITDSPLLLSLIYARNETENFKKLVLDVHNRFNTLNIFLKREKKYNPAGRMQTEDEAKIKDNEIFKLLNDNKIIYSVMPLNVDTMDEIVEMGVNIINNEN